MDTGVHLPLWNHNCASGTVVVFAPAAALSLATRRSLRPSDGSSRLRMQNAPFEPQCMHASHRRRMQSDRSIDCSSQRRDRRRFRSTRRALQVRLPRQACSGRCHNRTQPQRCADRKKKRRRGHCEIEGRGSMRCPLAPLRSHHFTHRGSPFARLCVCPLSSCAYTEVGAAGAWLPC